MCCFWVKREFVRTLPVVLPYRTRRRFYNGGILFSGLVLVFIALISLWSFLLLVKTKFVVSGSFGGMSRCCRDESAS